MKDKKNEIWNLTNAILSKFSFLTALNNKIRLLFYLSGKVFINETIIISNEELFNYGYKDITNGETS